MLLAGLRSVLCIGAHVDDIEIGCGGTLLRLLGEHGSLSVHWVVLSGSADRVGEARDSARTICGPDSRVDLRVADFTENYFPYVGGEIKDYLARIGSEVSPDLVLTHRREDGHQDHRTACELTWTIFRNNLILEYEIPKWDGDMGRPNVYVPLDRALCERKVEHLMQRFPSQRDKEWFDPEVFWGLLRLRGVEARSPSGYAEAFYSSKLVLDHPSLTGERA